MIDAGLPAGMMRSAAADGRDSDHGSATNELGSSFTRQFPYVFKKDKSPAFLGIWDHCHQFRQYSSIPGLLKFPEAIVRFIKNVPFGDLPWEISGCEGL